MGDVYNHVVRPRGQREVSKGMKKSHQGSRR